MDAVFTRLKDLNRVADLNGLEVNTIAIGNFIQWFKINEGSLKELIKTNKLAEAMEFVSSHYFIIDSRLGLEFGFSSGIDEMALFVCANYNPELIPLVEVIVSTFPKISGWNIIAFRQPKSHNVGFILNGKELYAGDFAYKAIASNSKFDIYVYIDDYLEAYAYQYVQGLTIIIDNLLGEFVCMTKVNGIGVFPKDADFNFLPLTNLFNSIITISNE